MSVTYDHLADRYIDTDFEELLEDIIKEEKDCENKEEIIQEFKEKFVIMYCQSMTIPELNGNIWNDKANPDSIIKFLEERLNNVRK